MTKLFKFRYFIFITAVLAIAIASALFSASYAQWVKTDDRISVAARTGTWGLDLKNLTLEQMQQILIENGCVDANGNAHGVLTNSGKVIPLPGTAELQAGTELVVFAGGAQALTKPWENLSQYSIENNKNITRGESNIVTINNGGTYNIAIGRPLGSYEQIRILIQ